MHQRPGPQPPGLLQQHAVLQGQQAALGVDAVGEGGQAAHIGQDRRQLPALDIGVGVAVGEGLPQLHLVVGDDQTLPGPDLRLAQQAVVVAVELPQGDAVFGGDGGQALPRLDHVKGADKLHRQGLPHRQGPVLRHAVGHPQQLRVYPVPPRDAVQGLPRLNDVDRHVRSPQNNLCLQAWPHTVYILFLERKNINIRRALDFTPGLEADRSFARRPVTDASRTKAPGRMAGRFVEKVL